MSNKELLSPAGDFKTALAAFDAGADAVYCGMSAFSARASAKNFSYDELSDLLRVAGARNKKVYVAVNTIVDECQVENIIRLLAELNDLKPDAIIVQDLGVARLARKYFQNLVLHASTQLVAHNLEGVLALKELGFKRVVLARELSLQEITSISKRCGDLELECFIHGALCYSVSGLCLFSAMEKKRSGNRGACAYCCRLPYDDENGRTTLAYSMKDLRLAEDVRKLLDAGVVSLKIEGRMKSALYVAAVTRYYRDILDEKNARAITNADLETVFSRRTTPLHLNGRNSDVIDPNSLGHLGTPIGVIKRITRDRENRAWLRFHTSRALEKHDGLQFESPDGGKSVGFGISSLRLAISRANVFEVSAGSDIEVLLPSDDPRDTPREQIDALKYALKPGATVYCSMSNAVKRAFPVPSFRSSDYPGRDKLSVSVEIKKDNLIVTANNNARVSISANFEKASHPEKTEEAIKKVFQKCGGTNYRVESIKIIDDEKLFVPISLLNDARRDLLLRCDSLRLAEKEELINRALNDEPLKDFDARSRSKGETNLRIRVGQKIPNGSWHEIIVAIDEKTAADLLPKNSDSIIRLALPVYNSEVSFPALRTTVKKLIRLGFEKWEASDLATLRLLRACNVKDISADWSLYAFNASALKQLSDLGVNRVVASPENNFDNLSFLAECGFSVEFLSQQSTPLFISLSPPAIKPNKESALTVYERGPLWITTRLLPRAFDTPKNVLTRVDLSWNA